MVDSTLNGFYSFYLFGGSVTDRILHPHNSCKKLLIEEE